MIDLRLQIFMNADMGYLTYLKLITVHKNVPSLVILLLLNNIEQLDIHVTVSLNRVYNLLC